MIKRRILAILGVCLLGRQFVTRPRIVTAGILSPQSIQARHTFAPGDGCPKSLEFGFLKPGPCALLYRSDALYLYSHFRDTDATRLRLALSHDGLNWSDIGQNGSFQAVELRDPSVMYVGKTFYFLATPSSGAKVQFFSSSDLLRFSNIQLIDMADYVPGATAAWAPE